MHIFNNINDTKNSLPDTGVAVLATGGTIAGRSGDLSRAGGYTPGVIEAEALLASVPGLDTSQIVRVRQVANIGSEHMNEQVWFALARALTEEAADPAVAGVVVLHGTDTMEETAFFLDLVQSSPKPVVTTGAMRPADALGADGPANMANAICLAQSKAARNRGVLVAMNEKIHSAARVFKTDTVNLDAFQSSPGGPLGRIVGGEPLFYEQLPDAESRRRADFSLSGIDKLPRVEILYGHAGQGRELIDAAVASGAEGIVHAGVGMGNIHETARAALCEAAAGGVPVVCASRVPFGPVPLDRAMRRDRLIAARNLNPQKARVLLQLALTIAWEPDAIQRLFDPY